MLELAADGDLSHRYLWGPAVDQLLADEQVDWSDTDADGETLWAMTDHLGSVRDVVDSNGKERIHRVFDSFGNITGETHYNASGTAVTAGQTGFVDEAFAFTGRYFDKDTGLQNNLHRWYDPAIGRWLSEDPIGFAAGDANLYRYVGNMPTIYIDPLGLAPWRQNREINWNGEKDARLRPMDGAFSHTIIYTTDESGNLEHTYSWGNEYYSDEERERNPSRMFKDDPRDRRVAQQAIRDTQTHEALSSEERFWNPISLFVSEQVGDDDLDEWIEREYQRRLDEGENSDSAHANRGLWNNCKSEIDQLIDDATRRQRESRRAGGGGRGGFGGGGSGGGGAARGW